MTTTNSDNNTKSNIERLKKEIDYQYALDNKKTARILVCDLKELEKQEK